MKWKLEKRVEDLRRQTEQEIRRRCTEEDYDTIRVSIYDGKVEILNTGIVFLGDASVRRGEIIMHLYSVNLYAEENKIILYEL